jgi:hypothetical protein
MNRKRTLEGVGLAWFCMFVFSNWLSSVQAQSAIRLEDITQTSGIDFKHFSGQSGENHIIETVTSGLATFDYDQDGWIDVYVLNGSPLHGKPFLAPPKNRLYQNVRGQFVDVTEQSGAGDLGFALGVAVGDFDNDGDPDLFISNFGPNVLLVNRGDGTFGRIEFPQKGAYPRVGAGVSLLDVDSDGNLDVYFSNYIKFSFEKKIKRLIYGIPAAPGPKDYDPDSDTLYRNMGDGSFEDVSESSGIASVAGPGMGVVAFDFDSDHDTDIFVCNDSSENFLFENKGNFKFEEIGLIAGVAYDVTGARQATMGVDVADFDGDGHLDIVTTNFIDEIPTLYRNSGKGYFDDIGPVVGLGAASRSLTWGVAFADFDLDQWPDLYIASGHLIDGISRVKDNETFAQPNHLFRNINGARFEEISSNSGTALKAIQVSRGVAVDDLDNDGDCDVVILNLNDKPQIVRNETDHKNLSLQVHLVGKTSNRDAVGAVIQVKVGDRTQVQEVISGRGYQSHFSSRMTFGCGASGTIESISVRWPGGNVQEFNGATAGERILLLEGEGQVTALP